MFEGRLVEIAVASAEAADMRSVPRAALAPGRGVEGDTRAGRGGAPGDPVRPDHEVTLIEAEAIEAIARESSIVIEARAARRNLVTRGVPLNHLVGRRFRVGDAVLEGLRLCEPCPYLESKTVPGIMDALRHSGGLRARVVEAGVVRAGDPIRPADGVA
jgi:MOSC domain-containing protein YiiM